MNHIDQWQLLGTSSKEPRQRQREGGREFQGPECGEDDSYTSSLDFTLWKAQAPPCPFLSPLFPARACGKHVGAGESHATLLCAPHRRPSRHWSLTSSGGRQQHPLFFPWSRIKIPPPKGGAGAATGHPSGCDQLSEAVTSNPLGIPAVN